MPTELTCCVDVHHFTSCIELGYIKNIPSFDDMINEQLCKYLGKDAEDSKDAVALKSLNELVEKKLKTNMVNRNDKFGMQSLFPSYPSMLS